MILTDYAYSHNVMHLHGTEVWGTSVVANVNVNDIIYGARWPQLYTYQTQLECKILGVSQKHHHQKLYIPHC